MKSVGIKILKNNLSKYLNLVRNGGEIILVTDRDEVIAEISKPTSAVPGLSRWEMFLNAEEKRGALRRATRRESRAGKETKAAPAITDWWSLYEEIRGDRF